MKTIVWLWLSLFVLPQTAFSQTPANADVITGQVVNETGTPLVDATVTLHAVRSPGEGVRTTVSDDEGKFRFSDLNAREYFVNATAPGYTEQRQPRGFSRPGSNITLTLMKGGVITGRVTNAQNQPVVAVRVSALLTHEANGSRVVGNVGLYTQLTDDRGEYRLYGLREGSYVVLANAPETTSFSASAYQHETPTYYPSADRAAAEEISIKPGDEARGIDIRYRGERGHTISGKVAGAIELKESNSGNVEVILKQLASDTVYATTSVVTFRGQTDFSFPSIPDGEYELIARRYVVQSPTENAFSAPRRIQVKHTDVTGVTLTLMPLGSVAGRLTFSAPAPALTCAPTKPLALENMTLAVIRVEPRIDVTGIRQNFVDGVKTDDKGNFVIGGLSGGTYALRINSSQSGWYVETLALTSGDAGRTATTDLSRTGLVLKTGENLSGLTVSLAVGTASLYGRVLFEGTQRPARTRVYVIPAEPTEANDLLRYAETFVETNGVRFGFNHLRPGRYRVVAEAVPADEPRVSLSGYSAWDRNRREHLRRLAASQPEIELKACEQKGDQELRLAGKPTGKP